MFIPEEINLGTFNENVNFEFTIIYRVVSTTGIPPETSETVEDFPVIIEAINENPTVIVEDNVISGYYDDSFDNDIFYRTIDDRFVKVDYFEDIIEEEKYGIYHYKPDTRSTIIYSYLAKAYSGTIENIIAEKVYTITVQNNWTTNKNKLIRYINRELYNAEIASTWSNENENTITWNNDGNSSVTWER